MSIFRNGAKCSVLVLLSTYALHGWTQNYPAKPIRYLIGASTGSGGDNLARLIAAAMTQVVGQQVIVENRPGAGGNLVAEATAKAPPDGHTLFQVTIAYAAYPALYRDLQYDLIRDFAPVTQLATAPYLLLVHPSLPVKTIRDLIRLAKARPGAIDYSSAGSGTPTFLAAELFKAQAGIDMLHVPYKGGGPAANAVISGEVSVHFQNVPTSLPHLHERRVRALGITSAKRMSLIPDVPTIAESGLPGFETGNWYGILVPAKTPKEIIAAIRSAAIKVINRPDVSKRLIDQGNIPVGDQPEEFAAHIKSEIDRVGKIVRTLNLKAE